MFRDLMRKKQQLSREECIALLQNERRGILSVCGEDGYPYGMPMNFFYRADEDAVYFHCGRGGHRYDALLHDARVSFCVCEQGCASAENWALRVRSVIVFGRMEILDDRQTAVEIGRELGLRFTQDEAYIQKEIDDHADRTLILRLRPAHMCGKVVTEA